MKAYEVVTLLTTLSPIGAYAGLCRPSSALSSSTTAPSESSTLVTDSTTVSMSTLSTTASLATDSTASGESSTSATETISTSTLSTTVSTELSSSTTDSTSLTTSVVSTTTSGESNTDSTTSGESSSLTTDSTTVSTSILSTTTSDAATTTTSAAAQGIEGPNGCCGYPGYFDGHVLALSGLAGDLTAEECAAMCTSDLDCTWYIYYQRKDGDFQCNTYGATPPFVIDETKPTIYYPRECKTCAESQPQPPHQPSCIADIPCRDAGTLDGTQVQFLGLRSVSATENCGDVCATVPDCTHAYRFYDITYGYRCGLTQMGSDTVFIPGTEFYQLWYSRGCNLDTCRDE
ncbi:Apple domain-containing protein [Fusarium falciforme]|uniref:Apple domain-containing protein n=1 Tax=Fusarium falciforme TaxID=195108 RepID=UPI002300A910|nr:Apple domain-containing protein [Fusarium falciforme]WAO91683.1 Apple domain-containing protein [Fusarium falciforme]